VKKSREKSKRRNVIKVAKNNATQGNLENKKK
jgi:hypothetical protein